MQVQPKRTCQTYPQQQGGECGTKNGGKAGINGNSRWEALTTALSPQIQMHLTYQGGGYKDGGGTWRSSHSLVGRYRSSYGARSATNRSYNGDNTLPPDNAGEEHVLLRV